VLRAQERPKLTLAKYDPSGRHLLGDKLALPIYLLSPEFAGAFAPGVNNLRLHVSGSGDDTDRVATTPVTLRDFTVFGHATGVFESGEQRSGGYEGSFVPFANSVAASGGHGLLVTGFVSIISK